MKRKELNREQVRSVIEGKCTNGQVPNVCSFWVMPDLCKDRETEFSEWKNKRLYDIRDCFINIPDLYTAPKDNLNYRWAYKDVDLSQKKGIDNSIIIEEWEDAEEFYENFPSPEYAGLIPAWEKDPDKYLLSGWWYCLFERHWSLRGMENALMDFYLYPEEVHRLYRKLTDFYLRIIERIGTELHADGILVSDDLGAQAGPLISPDIFREFFKPYYKEIFDKTHEYGMHFWLHSCGNIEVFLEDFIEIGLDVIHPIQKYTMDEKHIADTYGGRICFCVGMDVQRLIPFGTPQEVREEIRQLYHTFYRKEGKFMITMGNAITPDCRLENLDALYDELEILEEEAND